MGSWALRRVFEESCDAIACVVVLMAMVRESVRDVLFWSRGVSCAGGVRDQVCWQYKFILAAFGERQDKLQPTHLIASLLTRILFGHFEGSKFNDLSKWRPIGCQLFKLEVGSIEGIL